MDGVIIDSEPMHLEVETTFFESIGIQDSEKYLSGFYAINLSQMLKHLIKDYSLTKSHKWLYENIIKRKCEYFNNSELKAIPGIEKILCFLKENNIPAALASSSAPGLIGIILNKLSLTDSFQVVISGESIKCGKPEPDIFLATADQLGVNPDECIVIEDTFAGAYAAKKAKMTCVGYINKNSGTQDLSISDYRSDNMYDIYDHIVKLFLI